MGCGGGAVRAEALPGPRPDRQLGPGWRSAVASVELENGELRELQRAAVEDVRHAVEEERAPARLQLPTIGGLGLVREVTEAVEVLDGERQPVLVREPRG